MKKKPITVDDLWRIERIGTPSLSPDGAQCVCAVTRHSMDDNKASAQLWLLSTLGGAPRALTTCGEKDGQPRWSPRGDRIAFVAKREQQGEKDEAPQLYLIAPDGGEATRAATVATGVEAFKWFPDGRRIAFVSWVWPDAKGAKANARRQQQFKERKESAYVTDEAWYRWWDRNLPMGRVAHLWTLDVETGRVRDLFEGTDLELTRADPDADAFDISPDGRRIAFAHDPAPRKTPVNLYALAEIDVASRRTTTLVRDDEWSFGAPCYAPDGKRVACVASRQGFKHTAPEQLALVERGGGWRLLSGDWDHEVQPPLRWHGDTALRFGAEQHGRRHLWRFAIDTRQAEVEVPGGWVLGFDSVADTVVSCADAADHPARLHARRDGAAPRRIEGFNDALLGRVALGRHEERWFTGAQGDRVQMWLTYPPGFDAKAKRKHALLHVIHGGPHTAAGDNWHYRWNNAVFAAQGYVVACVNYHGSSSFGFAFKDSITHRWGPLEQQDIEAATDVLLKERWADRRRVFATGGSYGGYMVAWLNGHVAPGRYAAYVCHAGCFDWVAMVADDAYGWHAKELGAAFWDDMAKVHAQSPHAAAGAMRTPTLVIHGALDYRVPDAQGLAYYNTLQSLGVDARLVWFPDENHWVLKPRNSRLWYAEFFDWLKRHDAGATAKRRDRGVS